MKISSKVYIKKEEYNKMRTNNPSLEGNLHSIDCYMVKDSNGNIIDIFIPSDFPFVYGHKMYENLVKCVQVLDKYALSGSNIVYCLIKNRDVLLRRMLLRDRKFVIQEVDTQKIHDWRDISG